MSADAQTSHVRRPVSTLELFFDLVFVFAITQLTAVLADDPTPRGLGQVLLMFGARTRLVGAVFAVLTIVIGLAGSAALQLAALVVVVLSVILIGSRQAIVRE